MIIKKKEEGQAMVEFALILPILIMLLCGIIDFGWIFGNQILANNAAREAARYTAIHYEDYDNEAEIISKAESIVIERARLLDDISLEAPIKEGEKIKILFKANIPILTPFTSLILGDEYQIEAKSIMRIE